MSNDYKNRILAALNKHAAKQIVKKRSKKNKKPEKEVERACLDWMRNKMGWDVRIFEAKATYNPYAGRWISRAMDVGVCDCMGIMPDSGLTICIEFKAKGRLKTFNLEKNTAQQEFIKQKIEQNAFACVVDSVELLQSIYHGWVGAEDQKEFLRKSLP